MPNIDQLRRPEVCFPDTQGRSFSTALLGFQGVPGQLQSKHFRWDAERCAVRRSGAGGKSKNRRNPTPFGHGSTGKKKKKTWEKYLKFLRSSRMPRNGACPSYRSGRIKAKNIKIDFERRRSLPALPAELAVFKQEINVYTADSEWM